MDTEPTGLWKIAVDSKPNTETSVLCPSASPSFRRSKAHYHMSVKGPVKKGKPWMMPCCHVVHTAVYTGSLGQMCRNWPAVLELEHEGQQVRVHRPLMCLRIKRNGNSGKGKPCLLPVQMQTDKDLKNSSTSRNSLISFLTLQAREAWGGTLASLNPKRSRSLRHFPAWNKLLFKVQCPVNMR